MANSIKKRGQKLIRRFSRATVVASEKGSEQIRRNLIDRIAHVRSVRLLVFEWGLLVTALILLALAQAFWFGDSYAENTYTTGGTYTEATIGEVNSMNPLFATTNSEKTLSKLMFATVAANDYSGHPGNQLAAAITAGDNGKKWTVRLRDDAKWSDGEPITMEDMVFTTNLIKNPAVSTVYDANLTDVKISQNENGEMVFDLPAPYADFMSALSFPLVPKHILADTDPKILVENDFSNAPITSGAFTFNALQTSGDSSEKIIYLSANQNYYQGRPLLNSFAVHTYTDKSAVIDAVNAGNVTATAELSATDADKIVSNRFNEKNSSLSSGAFLFFNLAKSSVGNRDLRNAIRQGVNWNEIRETMPEAVALDYPLLESQIKLTAYPTIPGYDFDAAKAKVTEVSGETPIHLNVATVNSGYLPKVVGMIVEDLKELGLEVELSIYEENQEFINNIVSKRNYDILVYEIELGSDPDLLPYYHSSQTASPGLNMSNYKNAIVDDLLIGARDTMDHDLRVKKYETILERWVSDVPAIGIYQANLTYFYNKNVRAFGNDVRLVTPLDRFTDITNWATVKTTKNKTP